MESNANENTRKNSLSPGFHRALTIASCLLLVLGDTGGPLTSRLYFRGGGTRQWLSSFLETAGFPVILLPLCVSYFRRRSCCCFGGSEARAVLMRPRIFAACAVLGLMTGADDYLYAYGLSFLPVSTSALLLATHLAFTALFAYVIVNQRFTPFSLNSIALLSVGALLLGLHGSSDRPAGVSKHQYLLGLFLTVACAALYGLVLPLVELTYAKAKQKITYTLVMEMQFVMAFFATAFCLVGMAVNKDFQAIPKEAMRFDLGQTTYYVVLVSNAILWQCFFLGAVGVIFCVNTLLTAIIVAALIPVTGTLGVVFYGEKFSSEKGVSLALSLWGVVSYLYGEYLKMAKNRGASLTEVSTSL